MSGTSERTPEQSAINGLESQQRASQAPVRPRTPSSWHETRALLRAHLSASAARGHLTRQCAVCHRLLRLALESRDTR